jgi:WD40 repeat protein
LLSDLELGAVAKCVNNVAAAPDRLGIAEASGDVRIIFSDGRQASRKIEGSPRALELLPDDAWIMVTETALGFYRGSRLVWSKSIGERVADDFGGLESPSGKWFVLVGLKDLWLHELGSSTMTPLEGHQASTLDATFDRAGTRIISTSQDGTAIIWDVEHARLEHRLISKAQYLASAVFDDSEHVIVALDGAGALQLFDADGGAAIGSIDGRMIVPRILRRAADGMLMAIDEHDNAVVVRIPRDTSSIADAERDLACKAPPNETVGTCTP